MLVTQGQQDKSRLFWVDTLRLGVWCAQFWLCGSHKGQRYFTFWMSPSVSSIDNCYCLCLYVAGNFQRYIAWYNIIPDQSEATRNKAIWLWNSTQSGKVPVVTLEVGLPLFPNRSSGGVDVFVQITVTDFQRYFKGRQTPIALHDISKHDAIM